jgi:8-oxo-dGTP pyrophosphatase MutT (NUDIX family)
MSKQKRRAYKVACAGCVVYRRRAGTLEVLLARREDSPWMLPRGKCNPEERPRTAAAREVLEETGVRVRPTMEVGAYTYPIGKARYKHVVFFAATVISGSPVADCREFSEVAWVPIDTALSTSLPRDAVMIDMVGTLISEQVL